MHPITLALIVGIALQGLAEMPEAYANAHYIWYYYAGIGIAAFLCLIVYKYITDRIDAKKA
jgi:hypothetical protein